MHIDDLPDLVTVFAKSTRLTDSSSPSVCAQPPNYCTRQTSDAPILDGRYASHSIPRVAAPVEIHHPAFAIFLGHVNDPTLSVPDDTVKTTAQFMLSQSQIATVENQRTNIRLHLGNLLGISAIPKPNWNRTSSHHVITIPAEANFGEQAALAIVEEKGELGMNGEPSVQGSFSYHAFWNDADRPVRRGLHAISLKLLI